MLRITQQFFPTRLVDDPAQMAFDDQTDQVVALLLALAEKLLSSGHDALCVRAYFDQCDGLDVDSSSLRGRQVEHEGKLKGHEFKGEVLCMLVERDDEVGTTSDHFDPASTRDNEGLVG